MAYDRLMVFTGNATPKLAADVVQHLNIHLGKAKVGRFSDGEVMVEVLENVRGKDVFVLQSICSPPNDNLMEVLVLVDALKRASASRVTAAIPYMGYARQDRRPSSARVAITAKVVANMLAFNVGVEIGQLLALSLILVFFNLWRTSGNFLRHAWHANVLLMTAGFILIGYQLTGYMVL
ncbi:MAG: ribose-phosphate pyrophosphokinase [Gammaproteobacteria bacterium]|nr:ribose-phosphate pyrophosphokinase [Gammaproteobacteria bacterium]